jgi:hypothetical protein
MGPFFKGLQFPGPLLLKIHQVPHGNYIVGIDIYTKKLRHRRSPVHPFEYLFIRIWFDEHRSPGMVCLKGCDTMLQFFIRVAIPDTEANTRL